MINIFGFSKYHSRTIYYIIINCPRIIILLRVIICAIFETLSPKHLPSHLPISNGGGTINPNSRWHRKTLRGNHRSNSSYRHRNNNNNIPIITLYTHTHTPTQTHGHTSDIKNIFNLMEKKTISDNSFAPETATSATY